MERYLNRCLSSLTLSQELMSILEVIVINDGSKDRSSEIAHSYQKKHPDTFRVIDKENGNYGSCINRGLKEAKGKYIKILDADDWFDTENFEEFLKLLVGLDVDCVMSDMIQVDEDGNTISQWRYSLPKEESFSIQELLKLDQSELLWMHCVAYKTKNLRSINYQQTEGISYTDQEWLFLPMATCKSLFYFPKTVYNYLTGRDGQTMNPEVYEKNYWQEIKGTINMAHELGQYQNGNEIPSNYLIKRLLGRAIACYGTFFEKLNMKTCHDEMVVLDSTLAKEFPVLYHELSDLSKANPFKKQYAKYNLTFPHFWIFLIWIWRKKKLQRNSTLILMLVHIEKGIRRLLAR